MEDKKLPNLEQPENNKETRATKKSGYFTKLQGFALIIATLIISIFGGYFISDKYVWANGDDVRLNQQLEYYQALVKQESNNSENRVNLGYSYHLVGKSDEAIKQLKLAIDLDKTNVGAYFNLGIVYSDEKRFDDALIQAKKAVDLAPKDYKGYLLQGMVYRELKKYDKALESLAEADRLMPVNTDIIFEIGRVAEDQGKIKDAEELYKECLNYDPLFKPASEALSRLSDKEKDSK